MRTLMCGLILWIVGNSSAAIAEVGGQWLSTPPESIAQWYKPSNKRQVWLHNMFKLRREFQAISEYLVEGEYEALEKWSGRFAEHYREIGKMVPEWKDELELEWLEQLEGALAERDQPLAKRALRELQQSCNGCHREYQAITALIYRTPDFSSLKVDSEGQAIPYDELMEQLSASVNRIKIAMEDGRHAVAQHSLGQLKAGLGTLASTCEQCHSSEGAKQRILGSETQHALEKLQQQIAQGDRKQAGKALGEVAVLSCARCHGVHRTLSAVRTLAID